MKILLVTASKLESISIENELNCNLFSHNENTDSGSNNNIVDHLICGWGVPQITYQLTQKLNFQSYDMVINAGIATAINNSVDVGDVVNVKEQQFANMVANHKTGINNLISSGYVDGNLFPYSDGVLKNPAPDFNELIPSVRGITNDLIIEEEATIREWYTDFSADIESNEGASIFYVCLQHGIPFMEIKAISNHYNKTDSWNIPLALDNLTVKLNTILSHFNCLNN